MTTACSCVIDWAATGSMLQGLGTFAGVAAVLVGANAWRRQKVAERRLEVAERILTATHKGRRALSSVRSRILWGDELAAAEAKLKDDPEFIGRGGGVRQRLVNAQAYFDRLSSTRDQQLELDECLPMARALFSEELESAVETLRQQFWIVYTYVDAYMHDEDGTDPEFTKRIRQALHEPGGNVAPADEVSIAVAEAIADIERICMPALRLEAG